jgi:hypothetical protein
MQYTRTLGLTILTPLERDIRDLLRQAQAVPMNTPGEAESARQLAESLRDYAAQATKAGFPYTCKVLLSRWKEIGRRLELMQEVRQATESDAEPERSHAPRENENDLLIPPSAA